MPADTAADADTDASRSCAMATSPFAVFSECPHCGGDMRPEHAHYRCAACGWRDSCCD